MNLEVYLRRTENRSEEKEGMADRLEEKEKRESREKEQREDRDREKRERHKRELG